MSAIHQIYCTHCTYGSSALERREGDLAHRTLGYSARAGSLEAADLRKGYRQVERYLYYYLPRDTPAEEKLLLTASTAPQRLVYVPQTNGLQVVGQVCYRATDSEGRPGSYFAHVLLREETAGASRWPALTCLRLWQAAGWVEEDSPALPFLLPPLKSVDDMLRGKRAAVGDRVLRSFLVTPAHGTFDDPGNLIPARLRMADVQQRQNLFVDILDAFLDACLTRHESLLLVAEPALAALLFYGLLRLLPDGPLREEVSFSTYEPNPDSICTTLAATLFCDSAANLSPPEALRVRGLVINTFPPRRAAPERIGRPYARSLVARLVQKDWPAVEILLGDLRSCGSVDGEGLQQLLVADRLLRAMLEPQASPPDDTWRNNPLMARYMRQVLCRKLAAADPAILLRPLVASASHMMLLDLLAPEAAAHPEARKAVEFLLGSLPSALLAQVVEKLGTALLAGYPAAGPALGGKLRQLLDQLHEQTAEFSSQLDLLLAGQDLLPEEVDRQRALAWSQCRQAIFDLGRLQSQRSRWRSQRPLAQIDAACQRLVEAAQLAMPPELVEDDPPGTGKLRRLQAIGQCLLGEALLPPSHWHHTALWKKAGWYFERGKWPSVPLASLRPKTDARRQWRIQAAVVAAALAVTAAILFVLLMVLTGGERAAERSPPLVQADIDASPTKPKGSAIATKAVGTEPSPRRPAADSIKPAASSDKMSQVPKAASGNREAPVQTPANAKASPPAVASLPRVAKGIALAKNQPPAKPQPPPNAEDRWQRDARRFAAEHHGVLIQQPISNGVAEVPQAAGQAADAFDPVRPFLGPGKIRNDSESFDFGNGFDGPVAPAHSQEVPGLAKVIGVQSVTVALESFDKGYRLVLRATSLPVSDANVEATVAQLRKRQGAIKQYLPQLAGSRTSVEERAATQKALVELLHLSPPAAPKRDDPRFSNDPKAWEEAVSQYEQKQQDFLRRLSRLGQNQFMAIGIHIAKIRREAQRDYDQRIDGEMRSRAKQILAVVYSSDSKVEPPATAAQPLQQVTEISGHFDQTSEDTAVAAGFIARVNVRIVAEPDGNLMPPSAWTNDGLAVKCVFTPAGGRPMVKEGVAEYDVADLSQGTEKISVRFRFFRRGIFEGEDPQLIAETTPYVLDQIRPKQHYTVTFRMPQDALRALRDPNTRIGPRGF